MVVDLPRCGPMLIRRVPNLVPIPGPRMERVTAGQRPRSNYGHHTLYRRLMLPLGLPGRPRRLIPPTRAERSPPAGLRSPRNAARAEQQDALPTPASPPTPERPRAPVTARTATPPRRLRQSPAPRCHRNYSRRQAQPAGSPLHDQSCARRTWRRTYGMSHGRARGPLLGIPHLRHSKSSFSTVRRTRRRH